MDPPPQPPPPPIDKKLAKKLAREKMLIQMRKDTLAREQALDKKTLSKIKDKWFDSLIDTKLPQMQDNLRQILHYMEKLVESDNFRKLLYEDEREELEEKTTALAKSHESALETLFDIYQKRVQDMNEAYTQTVRDKKTGADNELKKIEDDEKATQENLSAMLYQMQENKKKSEEMMNCDMFLKLDDERSKNTEQQENLQLKLEKKMEKRWGEITHVLNNYEENTKGRRKDYLVLKAKDDADSKIIYQQMRKTQKLFEQLDELKKCLDDCYAPKNNMTVIKDLREERLKFYRTFKELKRIVDEELKEDKAALKSLTMAANTVTEEMKKISVKGEQILTLFRICRRFETQYEKVIPTGNPINLSKVLPLTNGQRKAKGRQEKDEILTTYQATDGETEDFEIFSKFWRKVGKVRLSKTALTKCIENLEKENSFLKQVLVSYLKKANASDARFKI